MGAWGRPADYVCIAVKIVVRAFHSAEESDADSVRDGLLPGGGDDGPPRGCLPANCQVFVYVGDRHAAFANAAGNAFDGAVTNVAGAEDAGDASFEGEGLAVE